MLLLETVQPLNLTEENSILTQELSVL